MLRNAFRRSSLALVALCLLAAIPVRLSAKPNHDDAPTTTPIKHVVVIFRRTFHSTITSEPIPLQQIHQGNPPSTQKTIRHASITWKSTSGLLVNNPNGVNPFRIDRSVPNTCDQDHNYGDEQKAFDGGLMDKFLLKSCNDPVLGPNSTMGYYDGNTVTALWNYAQHFAMSDNHFGTTFGPSTPGLLNLVAGNTFEATITNGLSGEGFIAGGASMGAVTGDGDPAFDMCSNPKRTQLSMSGDNIGNLLNKANLTWGSFMGGFTSCTASHTGLTGLNDG